MKKEDALQVAVMNYLRYQYPEVLAIHVPNGGSRNVIEGAKLKRMGVKKGVPDILIFQPLGDYYSGLAIELKVKPNKVSKEQHEVMSKLITVGWKCDVCWCFDEAKETIDEYLLTKKSTTK